MGQLDLSWQTDALCQEVDTELFFPRKGHPEAFQAARAICGQCFVRAECLDYAMAMENDRPGGAWVGRYGVWGGLTPRQRAALSRQLKDTRTPTPENGSAA